MPPSNASADPNLLTRLLTTTNDEGALFDVQADGDGPYANSPFNYSQPVSHSVPFVTWLLLICCTIVD